ncbi:metal-response element-binding transcription factor 2 [Plakobranchus ocellatus]|uniref:Metal-response element-binding transcription factor 2 n=1 Tax=Plakobranchus ocellatus TaxID=259542 RepID=A0AAV4E0G9_9GAST|nr:metal-response element-binding transcription factor 2 [Plakobranchus ocellatus]
MKPRKNEKRKSSLKVSPNTLKNKKVKLLARWTDGLFYFVKVNRVSEANKTCSVEFEDKSTAQVHFKDLLEACLQCLKEQLLIGDHFYVFACAHCNHGKEFLHRMEMKWLDIVYVSLFHLIMAMATRYVDVEDVVTCIMNHCSSFKLKEALNGHPLNFLVVQERVLKVLRENSHIFVCAAELRKKKTLFGLRERLPRAPNSYCLPPVGEKITRESLQQASKSSKRITFSPSKCHSPVVYVTKGVGIHNALSLGPKVRESKMVKLARVKSEHNYCTPLKCPDGRQGKCRSDSPSSTSSSTDGSSSSSGSDSVDLSLFDSNNNSSPSKQITPRVPLSPSPPSLHPEDSEIDETLISDEDDDDEPKTRKVEKRALFEETRGRSRPSSSSKDSKNVCDRTSGKISQNNSTCSNRAEDGKVKASESELDLTPLSPDLSDASVCENKEEKRFWSLDIAFPQPVSFTGADHPFLTEYEQENLRQKRRHFEKQLEQLAAAMLTKSDEDAFASSPSGKPGSSKLPAFLPQAPGLKNVAGFKGELRSLIKTQSPDASASVKGGPSSLDNTGTWKGLGGKQTGSSSCPVMSTQKISEPSPERFTPTSRRNLRAESKESNGTNGYGSDASCSSCPSESTPAPLFVNGVKISPTVLTRLPLKNGSPSPSTTNSKSSPTSSHSSNGRSLRHHRASSDRSSGVKSSPTSSRKAKEEEKAAQKRLIALQRCLKNLSPTCGFHFPVLEQSHPAVADSLDLSSALDLGKAEVSGNGEAGATNGSSSDNGSHLRAKAQSCSQRHSPPSPLQAKPINECSSGTSRSHKTGGSMGRGQKRRHKDEDAEGESSAGKVKKGRMGQENVRRSHRSRCAVNRFQATLGGRRLMALSSSNSHSGHHCVEDQYDIIALRVAGTGAVEYLINWGA